MTFERVNQMVINLFRDLQTQEHMQVGAFYMICRKNGQVHVHALMIGKGRMRGKFRTLLNVNRKQWKRKWPFIADIQRAYTQNRAIGYLAAQFLPRHSDTCEVEYYNGKLLRKHLIEEPYRWPFPPILANYGEDSTVDEE